MVCGELPQDPPLHQGAPVWPLLLHLAHVPAGDALHGPRRYRKGALRQTDYHDAATSHDCPVRDADGDGTLLHHQHGSLEVRGN